MKLKPNLLNAGNWNAAVNQLGDNTLKAGSGARLSAMKQGYALSFDDAQAWEHPWFTSATWNGQLNSWQAKVRPGFVNGKDPQVPGVTVLDSNKNPMTATLTDFPWIPIHGWRFPGSAPSDVVPEVFFSLGVQPAPPSQLDGGEGQPEIDYYQPPDQPPPRSLVAVDLYLAQARPAYEGTAQVVDALGTGGSQVQYAVQYNTQTLDAVGAAPRLQQAALAPSNETPSLDDRLTGQFEDTGEDYLLISTIYLLSPPNVSGATPDNTWTPYVRHNCFWNLAYGVKNVPPPVDPQPITLITGLAGGFGDSLDNAILSQLNDESDQVLNALNAVTTAGIFWTV